MSCIRKAGNREKQIAILRIEITAIAGPVILMCDCNFTESSEAYGRLDALPDDSFRRAGRGFGRTLQPDTFPFRVQRIDYVWHGDELTAVDAYIGQSGGTDHHPVISALILESTPDPEEDRK